MECVELACGRTAAAVSGKMSRGIASLATISAVAPFIGFFGTVLGIFKAYSVNSGSKVTEMHMVSSGIADSLFPTLLGLLVAIVAYWCHQYLLCRMEFFDMEIESMSMELINRLGVQVRPTPQRKDERRILFTPNPSIAGPRLILTRMYRNGVLELIWPRIESQIDADCVLHASMGILFAYGLLGWLTYYWQGRTISGITIAGFLILAALGVRTASRSAVLAAIGFFAWALLASLVSFGLGDSSLYLLAAPILLIGSVKAARFLSIIPLTVGWPARLKRVRTALSPWPGILFGLFASCACVTVLFGTVLSLFSMGAYYDPNPNVRPGDRMVSLNPRYMGAIYRGELVAYPFYWNVYGSERVAGLPGDRIEVKSGRLIRNGTMVSEPYNRMVAQEAFGDFPLPTDAYPDDTMRWEHAEAYGDRLRAGTTFTVPKGGYFLLNDDRNRLFDSRVFGPVSRDEISGRTLFTFRVIR
jgi:signal peptidase I